VRPTHLASGGTHTSLFGGIPLAAERRATLATHFLVGKSVPPGKHKLPSPPQPPSGCSISVTNSVGLQRALPTGVHLKGAMTLRIKSRLLATGSLLLSLCGVGVSQQSANSGPLPVNPIIEKVEKTQSGVRPQLPYQVLREYRLFGANSSTSNSSVVAEVNFKPPTSKDYKIQKSSGSKRGEQVVRHLLDHEVEGASSRSQARTALTRDNYDFTYIGEVVLDGQPCYLLGLKPKRKEKDLIAGEAWIDKHSFLVRRIEGEIAKTPSWWLKKVHLKLVFADFEGTWLQTSMEAVADVRIVGPHTLTSQILDYRGRDVMASTQTRSRSADRKH
jgi:hypothetical protein